MLRYSLYHLPSRQHISTHQSREFALRLSAKLNDKANALDFVVITLGA